MVRGVKASHPDGATGGQDHGGRRSTRRSYHHGDLPATLVATAVELIAEHGPHGFSLAEAARRAGVSIAAPYRHFPDKESLLAAVGLRAYATLGPRLDAATRIYSEPADQLTAAAAAYVRFAVEEAPLFAVLFGAGVDKSRFPELARAAQLAYGSWLAAARRIVPEGDEAAALDLAVDVLTVVHGTAALLADGQFGDPQEQVDPAERRARRVVTALLSGRSSAANPAP